MDSLRRYKRSNLKRDGLGRTERYGLSRHANEPKIEAPVKREIEEKPKPRIDVNGLINSLKIRRTQLTEDIKKLEAVNDEPYNLNTLIKLVQLQKEVELRDDAFKNDN